MNEMCSRVSNSFQCLLRNLWNLFYAHFQEFASFSIKTFEWLTNSWQSFKILNFPLRIVKSWGRKFCENQKRRRWRISSWKLTDVSVFQVSRDFSSSSLRSLFSQPSALRGERIQQTEDASCSGERLLHAALFDYCCVIYPVYFESGWRGVYGITNEIIFI